MTFIPNSPISSPRHECAVTNDISGPSGGYNDLPLRLKSSSLHLRCNEGKRWLASFPLGSEKWTPFKKSAIPGKAMHIAIQSQETFTYYLLIL